MAPFRALRALSVAAVAAFAAAGCTEERPSSEALRLAYNYYATTAIEGEAGEWRQVAVSVSGAGVHVRLALPAEDAERLASAPGEEGASRLAQTACPPEEHEVWTLLGAAHDILLSARKKDERTDLLADVSCRQVTGTKIREAEKR